MKLALLKKNNDKYALKIYEKYKISDPHKLNNVKREIAILKKTEHPNIIKLYCVFEDKRQVKD